MSFIEESEKVIVLKLSDIKTLREVSEETGIYIKTLLKRIDLKSYNMIEGIDFRKLGKRQPIILSPEGIKKITKNK